MRVLFLSALLMVDCMIYKFIYMYIDLLKLCILIYVPKGTVPVPGDHRLFFFPYQDKTNEFWATNIKDTWFFMTFFYIPCAESIRKPFKKKLHCLFSHINTISLFLNPIKYKLWVPLYQVWPVQNESCSFKL